MALNDTIESDVSAMSPPSADDGMRYRELSLQTLEVFLSYEKSPSGRLFYSKDKFSGSVDSWNGKYFIYSPSKRHLDWEKYLQNPAKELQKYDARLVGLIQNPLIPESGTPRLDCMGYFWDDAANKLADEGKLGISTDFNVPIIGEEMAGYPMPNYVLVFPIDAVNDQNDIGARVLNSSVDNLEDKMDDETKSAIAELKGLITGFFGAFKAHNVQNSAIDTIDAATVEAAPSVPVEYLNQIEQMKAENEKTSAELTAIKEQYEALKTDAATREEADKQAEVARLEATWQTTIMPKLPAALLIDEAKKAEIKDMAINKPLDFLATYGEYINKADVSANVANSATAQTVQNSIVEEKPIVLGSYNARIGGFE